MGGRAGGHNQMQLRRPCANFTEGHGHGSAWRGPLPGPQEAGTGVGVGGPSGHLPGSGRGSGPARQQGRLQPVLPALPTWACSLVPGWRSSRLLREPQAAHHPPTPGFLWASRPLGPLPVLPRGQLT